MTSDVVTLRLFGTPTLYRDAQVTHISRRKAQGLLAYLALADRPVPRSELCGRFWPDLRIEAARRALRTVLSEVRTLLPDGVLDASRDAVALRCGDLLQTDALVFEREAGRLLDAVRRRGGELSTEDLGQIDALNELAGAPFLDGFSLPDCADFDDWQFMTGERLRGRRMELLWAQITACVERDDRIRAIAAARALLALDPSDDETHRELMVLLTEVGASGAAIAQARVFERIAEHENDEPDYASVRELTDAIRQQRTACLPDESKSAESRERERAMQDTDERRIVSLVGVWSDDVALESVAAAAADLCDGTVADRASTGSNAAVLTFGLARTHDDDPARAVMAARSLAAYLAAQGGTIRAVVRTAIVSPSDIETALVAMRATVARLGAGEVAVCDATRRAIDGLQTEPIESGDECVFHRVAATAGSRRSDAPGFVGRRREMHDLVGLCRDPAGRVALVSGEAGIGKSRLVDEARRVVCDESDGRAVDWVVCCASEHRRKSLFLAFRSAAALLVERLAGPRLQGRPLVSRCVEMLVSHEELLPADIVPATGVLHRLLYGDPGTLLPGLSRSTESEAFIRESRTVITALVRRVAASGPMVLVFEDLHWADRGSAAVLVALAHTLATVPLSLVITYRPHELGALRSVPEAIAAQTIGRHTHIQLDHLSPHDSMALYDELAGTSVDRDADREAMVDRSEGNPLYLVELARFQRTAVGGEPLVPQTLARIVQRRSDALPVGARRVLEVAAVAGSHVSLRMLEIAVSRLCPECPAGDVVALLEEREFVRAPVPEPDDELEFVHALIRDAVLARIPANRLRAIHGAILEACERLMDAGTVVDLEFAAHHADRSGDPDRARRYLAAAGHEARLSHDRVRAIERYARAIDYGDGDRALHLAFGQVLHEELRVSEAAGAYRSGFALPDPPEQRRTRTPSTLRFAQAAYPFEIDWLNDSTTMGVYFQRPLYRSLARMRVDGLFVPDGAASWEMSENGLEIEFTIRDDLFWSDGAPVLAEDYRQGLVRSMRRNYACIEQLQVPVRDAEHLLGDDRRAGIRAIDEKTLRLLLDRPEMSTIYSLSALWGSAVPSHQIARYGDRWSDPGRAVFAGAFVIDHFGTSGNAVLIRNPHAPSTDGIAGNVEEIRFMGMRADRLLDSFVRGECDLVSVPRLETRRALTELSEFVRTGPAPGNGVLALNFERGPLRRTRVRRALAQALDRHELVRLAFGGAHHPATGGIIPPAAPGHSPDLGLPFDPDRARSLLTAEDRAELEARPLRILAADSGRDIAEFVVRSWYERLDLSVELTVLAFVDFLTAVLEPGWDGLIGATTGVVYPQFLLRGVLYARFKQVPFPLLSSRADVEWALEPATIDERLARFRELDRRITQDALSVPLFYLNSYMLVQPWVSGFRAEPAPVANFEDVIVDFPA